MGGWGDWDHGFTPAILVMLFVYGVLGSAGPGGDPLGEAAFLIAWFGACLALAWAAGWAASRLRLAGWVGVVAVGGAGVVGGLGMWVVTGGLEHLAVVVWLLGLLYFYSAGGSVGAGRLPEVSGWLVVGFAAAVAGSALGRWAGSWLPVVAGWAFGLACYAVAARVFSEAARR